MLIKGATGHMCQRCTKKIQYTPNQSHDNTSMVIKTMTLRQNGRHFVDDIFPCIFLNENVWILKNISLKFVPKSQINKIPALVQIMAWHWPGDKPLSKPMMFSLLMHICVTLPQWVNTFNHEDEFPFVFFFYYHYYINSIADALELP